LPGWVKKLPTLILSGRYDESISAINELLKNGIAGRDRISLKPIHTWPTLKS
jgi:hypothetical protein